MRRKIVLKVKAKTVKVSEENTGTVSVTGQRANFLMQDTEAVTVKANTNKLDFIET